MSKRKRFSISQELQQGLSDTANAVKNNAGAVRFEVIALSRIEVDPDNPRVLKISAHEIRNGLNKSDTYFRAKTTELEGLQQLADTIRKKGLINPVVVYKHSEFYRLVAGERRYLASILAGKDDIQARILNEKPKNLDLRLLQWIENTEREDLSLKDRIGNVRAIVSDYQKGSSHSEISATLLKELIGISLPQATCYISVLNATPDLNEQIQAGKINNLDKAAFLAKITSQEMRKRAIELCISGGSLKQLRNMIEQIKLSEKENQEHHKKRGRVAQRINLGFTTKPQVVKKLASLILQDQSYKVHEQQFLHVDWNKFDQATKAFQKLLKLIENERVY